MLRTLKKLFGKTEKDICPVCKTLTYFHKDISYAGMDYSAMAGPSGDIRCETCGAEILVTSASANSLHLPYRPLFGHEFYVGKDIHGTLTEEQAKHLLAIAF